MASFSIVDYIIFALVLLISAFIGLFFGFCRKKANTSDEVLLGNRKMGVRNKINNISIKKRASIFHSQRSYQRL